MTDRITVILAALGVLAFARLAPAQCPDGTPPPCSRSAPPARSIAVLTFENVTRDTSAQYLAEGLADQIFTRLGSVARLTMVSRTAVRRLRNVDQLSVQQIGHALNAAFLVNGTIQATGGRVRVNVEALRAATGAAVWSEAYDRASDDLIGLEEAIATEVAAGVAGRLSPQERRALTSRLTASSRAYEQFLRGNVLLGRRTRASLEGAIAAYQAATTSDSGLAEAYGRLAYALALCGYWEWCGNVASFITPAQASAARALRLSPRSSDAWMGRGLTLALWSQLPNAGGDDSLPAALAAFRRAVALNPHNDEAWHQYGFTLSLISDSASLDAMRQALAIEPARAVTYQDISVVYYLMGRNTSALLTVDSAVALDPDGPFRKWRALYRLTAGDTTGAVADARLTPSGWWSPAILAAFAHDSAAVAATRATVTHPPVGIGPGLAAACLLWTGQREQAVQSVLRSGPSLWTRWVLRVPVLAPLADDPRIRALRAASDSILARTRWR